MMRINVDDRRRLPSIPPIRRRYERTPLLKTPTTCLQRKSFDVPIVVYKTRMALPIINITQIYIPTRSIEGENCKRRNCRLERRHVLRMRCMNGKQIFPQRILQQLLNSLHRTSFESRSRTTADDPQSDTKVTAWSVINKEEAQVQCPVTSEDPSRTAIETCRKCFLALQERNESLSSHKPTNSALRTAIFRPHNSTMT